MPKFFAVLAGSLHRLQAAAEGCRLLQAVGCRLLQVAAAGCRLLQAVGCRLLQVAATGCYRL